MTKCRIEAVDKTWVSPHLGHEMTVRLYGDCGKAVLVFPQQEGHYFDFENFGMLESCRPFIEQGIIRLFCVDSVDCQSWANYSIAPGARALRHERYHAYLVKEVMPFIQRACGTPGRKSLTLGCSMGGFHAANLFFRRPDLVDGIISLSGIFDLRIFIGDYMDEAVYFNSPLHYLTNLSDPEYIDLYRESQIIIGVGQGSWEEDAIAQARALGEILAAKKVPAWIDYWGFDVSHDWPWWQKQLAYFLEHLYELKK